VERKETSIAKKALNMGLSCPSFRLSILYNNSVTKSYKFISRYISLEFSTTIFLAKNCRITVRLSIAFIQNIRRIQ
jgi:hypothetical protein